MLLIQAGQVSGIYAVRALAIIRKRLVAESVWSRKVTLRSYFDLFNFKANHRKTLVVDTDQGWKALVTSMNPHDGSSRHSNIGLLVWGRTAIDILATEQAVGIMSQANMPAVIAGEFEAENQPQVQVLTEKPFMRGSKAA